MLEKSCRLANEILHSLALIKNKIFFNKIFQNFEIKQNFQSKGCQTDTDLIGCCTNIFTLIIIYPPALQNGLEANSKQHHQESSHTPRIQPLKNLHDGSFD